MTPEDKEEINKRIDGIVEKLNNHEDGCEKRTRETNGRISKLENAVNQLTLSLGNGLTTISNSIASMNSAIATKESNKISKWLIGITMASTIIGAGGLVIGAASFGLIPLPAR